MWRLTETASSGEDEDEDVAVREVPAAVFIFHSFLWVPILLGAGGGPPLCECVYVVKCCLSLLISHKSSTSATTYL